MKKILLFIILFFIFNTLSAQYDHFENFDDESAANGTTSYTTSTGLLLDGSTHYFSGSFTVDGHLYSAFIYATQGVGSEIRLKAPVGKRFRAFGGDFYYGSGISVDHGTLSFYLNGQQVGTPIQVNRSKYYRLDETLIFDELKATATGNGHFYIDDVSFSYVSVETITNEATAITYNSAVLGGDIINDSNGAHTIIERGILYTTIDITPEIGSAGVTQDNHGTVGDGNFSKPIPNLNSNTTYYYRAYAKSNTLTFYGSVKSFTTDKVIKVISITRKTPTEENTPASSTTFNVIFNEEVNHVDNSDFVLSGTASGNINSVTKINNKTYEVLVNNISGSGTLQLNIKGVNNVNGSNDIKEIVNIEEATIAQTQTNDYLNQSKIGQTFKAIYSSTLTKVIFYPKQANHTFSGTADLNVFDGDETSGGTLLSTQQINITNNTDTNGQTFVFTVPKNLTAGNTYSITLTNFNGTGNIALESNTTETYTDGHVIFTGQTASHDTFDLKIKIFETYVTDGDILTTITPTTHESYNIIGLTQLSTTPPTNISNTSITLGGDITSANWGIVNERGIIYAETATNATPTIGSNGVIKKDIGTGIGEFSEAITGLDPNTNFSYRAYAINEKGTAYGEIKTFTISATLTTNDVSFINTKLYPNPVKNHLTIVTETNIEKVIIYNLLGKEIYTQKVQSRITEIPFNQFKAGIYLVKIQGERNSTTQKVIKL